jgi:hypothetical protein
MFVTFAAAVVVVVVVLVLGCHVPCHAILLGWHPLVARPVAAYYGVVSTRFEQVVCVRHNLHHSSSVRGGGI